MMKLPLPEPTVANSSNDRIQAVSVDDMVFMAERLLRTMEEFRAAGKPTAVDLGYHYTRSENLTSIRQNGLMSKVERDTQHVKPIKENGSTYGKGIYSARSPTAFVGSFGDVGLVIARLRGVDVDHGQSTFASAGSGDNLPDSTTVHRHATNEFTVLSSSSQCIPVLQYPSAQVVADHLANPGNLFVQKYHTELQSIIDDMFNGDAVAAIASTPQTETSSPFVTQADQKRFPVHSASAFATQPPTLSGKVRKLSARKTTTVAQATASLAAASLSPLTETLHYVAPVALDSAFQDTDNLWYYCHYQNDIAGFACSVCCKELNVMEGEPIVALLRCGHCFHEFCLVQSLSGGSMCPMCRISVDKPQGDMPSGTMTIRTSTMDVCAGYEQAGSIVIEYNIPAGRQLSYHANPGADHSGAQRTAYLPDTSQGRSLLKRLQYAFAHGLTFTVGASLSSGLDNCVTWTSIPHKTMLTGGAASHGFPDPMFFDDCDKELDAVNVPAANAL
jgi:deltex